MHFHSFIHSFVRSFIHSSVSSSIKHLLKICHTLDTVLDPEDTATRRTQKSLTCLYHCEQSRQQTRKRNKVLRMLCGGEHSGEEKGRKGSRHLHTRRSSLDVSQQLYPQWLKPGSSSDGRQKVNWSTRGPSTRGILCDSQKLPMCKAMGMD